MNRADNDETRANESGDRPVRHEDLLVSVKDEIVRILAYGATPVSTVKTFLHGEEKRSVCEVIEAYPDLFEVFERGFPDTGPKSLWVRLKRTGDG